MSEFFGPGQSYDPGGGGGKLAIIVEILADALPFLKTIQEAKEQGTKTFEEMGSASKKMTGEMAKNFEKDVGRMMQNLKTVMQEFGVDASKAGQILRAALGPETAAQAGVTAEAVKRLGGEFKGVGEEAEKAKDPIRDMLESMVKRLSAVAVLVKVVQSAWRFFINTISEATEEWGRFTLAQFRFEVGVRAAQRQSGIAAGTMEEWAENVIELREQFQIFSRRDIMEAIAKVVLLTRELGFTKQQMQETSKAALILAEVNGVTVAESARRLAFFLDTGISRGLQTMGVQVNKAIVEQEAFAMGIEKTWNEMTRQERAAISLTVIMEQVGDLTDDAGRAAETYWGQLALLEAAQDDVAISMGQDAGFIILSWKRIETFVVVKIIPRMIKGLRGLAQAWTVTFGLVAGAIGLVTSAWVRFTNFFKTGEFDVSAIFEDALFAFRSFIDQVNRELFPALSLGDVGEEELGELIMDLDEAGDAIEDFDKLVEKSLDDIDRAFQQFADGSEDAFQRMEDSIEDLNRSFAFNLIDTARKFGEKLIDIDRKIAQRRTDIEEDFRLRIADVSSDAANKMAEAQAEAKSNELQEERKFQLEMLQLRRRFIFDLEDAVRERDARRVLDIIRRFNLEKAERTEDFDLRQRERQEELAQELADIQRTAAIKRAQLQRDLQIRLKELEIQRKRERAAARRDYLRDLEELNIREERRREAIQLTFDRRIRDLDAHLQRRLELIGTRLGQELKLNVEAAMDIVNIWLDTYKQISTIAAALLGLENAIRPAFAGISGQNLFTGSGPALSTTPFDRTARELEFAGRYQEGGSVVANRPSFAIFGERGPERATFTPTGGGGGEGRIGLDISVKADDGFLVEVSEQVMNDVADVLIDTQRGAQ